MKRIKGSLYTTVSHSFDVQRVEEVDCNLCGSNRYAVLGGEHEFEIRECMECGLIYVNPQPETGEMEAFYEGMYPGDGADAAEARSLGLVESHLRRLVRRRKPQGGSLLDVGCGYGGFLERMQDTGWRLAGLELNESAAAYAAQRVPAASLVKAPIEEAPIAPGSQDCVVASAVLEHVKDPRATLRRLSSWLAPGGLLVVLVPYVVPYLKLKRLMPFLPIHFEAPRHLFDFSPVTLTRYFEELGFRDIRRAIGRPYASPSLLVTTLIWAAKAPGLALHALTGGRYVYPFAGSLLVHGLAPPPDDSA